MKKHKGTYEKLRKTYTDEEIVESFVFNDDSLSNKEQSAIEKEFAALRLSRLKNMTMEQVRYGHLMQLKLSVKNYLSKGKFEQHYQFHKQLKRYSRIIDKTNKAFATDLGVHPTKFSRIINGREHPNIDLMYRLEEHSRGEIPAHHWWRLYALELEHKIKTDLGRKLEAAKKVKNQIELGV